ncbi:MAG: uL15 family ribosomal protein [Clostridia bacterium]|nr:uL15 family ribosomal protein [Clostridia bacterium]
MRSIKNNFKGIIALFMTLVMLAGACLPVAAFSITHYDAPDSAEPCYSIVYDDGKLKVQINAEIIYNVLKDKKLTKEELKAFLPEDILEAVESNATQEELIALVSQYITPEDIVEIISDMPTELAEEYLSLEILEKLVSLSDLLSAIPMDDIISAANAEDLEQLVLAPGVFELLFNDDLVKILSDDNAYITTLLDTRGLAEDVSKDAALKKQVIDLLNDQKIDDILADKEIKARLYTYLLSASIGKSILTDKDELEKIVNVLLDYKIDDDDSDEEKEKKQQRQENIDSFFTSPIVEDQLITAENILSQELITLLITNHIVDHDTINAAFTDAEIMSLLTANGGISALIKNLLTANNSNAFIENVLNSEIPEEIVNEISEIPEIKTIVENAVLSGEFMPTDPSNPQWAEIMNDQDLKASIIAQIKTEETSEKIASIFNSYLSNESFSYNIKGFIDVVSHNNDTEFMNILVNYIDFEKTYKLLDDDHSKFELILSKIGDHKEVLHLLDAKTLHDIVVNNKNTLFANEAVINEFVAIFDPLEDPDMLAALGGYRGILYRHCDLVTIIKTVITYKNLFTIVNAFDVVNAIGIKKAFEYTSVKEIVTVAGGADAVIALYDNATLTEIVNTIGIKELAKFANRNKLWEAIDLPATISDIVKIINEKGNLDGFKEALLYTTTQILANRIKTITIANATTPVFSRQFNLNALIEGLLSIIPISDEGKLDFVAALENGLSTSLSIVLTDTDETGNNISYDYELEISFIGDTSGFERILNKLNDYVEITVDTQTDENGMLSDLGLRLDATVPKAFSAVYAQLLNGEIEKVPTELRKLLINIPSMTPSDAANTIKNMSEEQKNELFNAVTNSIEKIKEKLYSALPEQINNLTDRKFFDDSLDKVEAIFDKLSKTSFKNSSIASIYESNGNMFSISAGKAINLREFIANTASIPDELSAWVASANLNVTLNAKVKVNGLYVFKITDENGNDKTLLVPEGTKINAIEELTDINIVDDNANEYPDNATVTGNSSANSGNRYYVRFHYSERPMRRGAMFDSELGYDTQIVFYNLGDTDITAPDIQSEDWTNKHNGYSYEWDFGSDFVLGEQKITDVYYKKSANRYTAYFECYYYNENNQLTLIDTTERKVTFTFGDTSVSYPAITGYHTPTPLSGHEYDPEKYEDQTIKLVYQKATTPPVEEDRVTILFTYNGNSYGPYEFEYGITAASILTQIVSNPTLYPDIAELFNQMNGYTPNISSYDEQGSTQQTVVFEFGAKMFTITWHINNQIYTEYWQFGEEDTYPLTHPSNISARKGYTLKWDKVLSEELFATPANIDVYGTWIANKYTITFVGYDANAPIIVTWEYDTALTPPSVPYKYGHDGAWEEYTLTDSDITVNAIYTLHVYKAKFLADGRLVATVDFTINDKSISAPLVPTKAGYNGVWEKYSLTDSDITINAIYTPYSTIDDGKEPDEKDDDKDDIAVAVKKWGWIGLILVALLVGGGLFGYFKMRDDDEPTPEPEPTPIPEPIPDPEPEAEPIQIVDAVSADQVDDLMSDDTALTLVGKKLVRDSAGAKVIVNLDVINKVFEAGDTVNIATLKEKKIISQKTAKIKILAHGSIEKPLNVEANAFSVQAIKMITLTGGTVTLTVIEE